MFRQVGTFFVIICCFVLLIVFPIKMDEKVNDISERSLRDKQITDIEYKILTEKRIETGDLGNISVEVEAFSDGIYVSFPEIIARLESDGVYSFTEKYVRITYDGEVRCIRVN